MRVSGAELHLFMQEGWPKIPSEDDWFWDHDIFDDMPDLDTVYDTDDLGPILFQGRDRDQDPTRGEGYCVARLIRKWRRERDSEIMILAVPKDKVAQLKAWMRENKARQVRERDLAPAPGDASPSP